ncbi:MAG: dynamin family protein [Polyangia bacterium]
MTSDESQPPHSGLPLLTEAGLRKLLDDPRTAQAVDTTTRKELDERLAAGRAAGGLSAMGRLALGQELAARLGPKALAQVLSGLGPGDLELSAETCTAFIDRALGLLHDSGVALPVRQRKLAELRRRQQVGSLQVGLLGITSSGKSALLNVLMGESTGRLPEAAAPTTRVRVVCWRGAKEQAFIHYPDNKVRVLEGETLAELARLCDERESGDAASLVQSIEWTAPNARIPSGVQLIDTPGLDPDLPLHDEMTRNVILRELDVVAYLKPVRAPFAGADLSLLESLVHEGQTVLLLLTKSDTVADLSEGAVLIEGAPARIAAAEAQARQALARYPGLRAAGVLTVSAHEHQGLEAFTAFLGSLQAARPTLLLLQKRRDLRHLLLAMAQDLDDLPDLAEEVSGALPSTNFDDALFDEPPTDVDKKLARRPEDSIPGLAEPAVLRELLRGALSRLRARESRLRWRWLGDGGTPRRLAQRMLRQIQTEPTGRGKEERAQASRRVGALLGKRATEAAQTLVREAQNTLVGLGLPLRQEAAEPAAIELALRDSYLGGEQRVKLSRGEAFRAQRGFFRGLMAFLRNDSYRTVEGAFDVAALRADLDQSIERLEAHVAETLDWLEHHVLGPLQQRLEQEVDAHSEAKVARQRIDLSTRESLRKGLEALAAQVAALPTPAAAPLPPLPPGPPAPAAKPPSRPPSSQPSGPPQPQDGGPLSASQEAAKLAASGRAHEALFGVLETFAETALQEELLQLLQRLTGRPAEAALADGKASTAAGKTAPASKTEDAARVPPAPARARGSKEAPPAPSSKGAKEAALAREPVRVLLLGADRGPLLHLCCLLAHSAGESATLALRAPADRWLRLGPTLELSGVPWWDEHGLSPAGSPLLQQVTLVVAPADEVLALAPPPLALLRRFDAVGVHLDAARIGHGRADLQRAQGLYLEALRQAERPVFFINGTGRDFDGQLEQLLSEVPDALEADFPEVSEWLIFDDYDVRYSRFVQLGRQVLQGKKSIPALWREAGLLFSGPFAEERLVEAIQEARRRRQKNRGPVREERVR